jgi:hypothetical protein
MSMFIARSLTFYPGYFEDNCQELSDEIILPSFILNKLMESFHDDEMLYINMTNTNTNQHYLVTMGSSHNYDKNTIFAPQWILELIGCTGCCDSVIKLEKADMDDVVAATKITIKPLDPIAFEIDTLELFEKALMNLHSIKENITIPIPVPQLGKDYSMFAHIEKVEPMSLSRITNGEVDVEFINEFTTQPSTPAPTPIGSSPLMGPIIPSSLNPILTPQALSSMTSILTPTAPPVNEVSAEERRRIIRESWVKRYESSKNNNDLSKP